MKIGSVAATRNRRFAFLGGLLLLTAPIPLVPAPVGAVLAVVVVTVIAKGVLEAIVGADSSQRSLNSLQNRVNGLNARLEAAWADAEENWAQLNSELSILTTDQRAMESQLGAIGEKLGSTKQELSDRLLGLSGELGSIEELTSTGSRRLDRVEAIATQLTAARGGRRSTGSRLGRGLDGLPESRLADAVARLAADLAEPSQTDGRESSSKSP